MALAGDQQKPPGQEPHEIKCITPLPAQIEAAEAKKQPHLKRAMQYGRGIPVENCVTGCLEELGSKSNPGNFALVVSAGAALRAMHELHKVGYGLPSGRDIFIHDRIAYAEAVISGQELDQIKADLLAVEAPAGADQSQREFIRKCKEDLSKFKGNEVAQLKTSLLSSGRTGMNLRAPEFTDFDNHLARERVVELVSEAAVLSRAYKNINVADEVIN
ncbi:MAG: hypothetical protein NTU61_04010, partial [Candidatus Altiarchaeota archaeon]|nr:hypothetical protein [Candidatus Altiarchaeota archaeon]